jgi:ribosome-binding factor A
MSFEADRTLEHAHRIESLLRQVRPDLEKGE